MELVYAHIDRIAQVTGSHDHAAIGSDLDGWIKPALPGLEHLGRMRYVQDALVVQVRRRGGREDLQRQRARAAAPGLAVASIVGACCSSAGSRTSPRCLWPRGRFSGVTYGDEWWTLLIAAAVFTVVNASIKPIVALLSIPFIVITLGIFYFLINVLMLYVTDWVVPRVRDPHLLVGRPRGHHRQHRQRDPADAAARPASAAVDVSAGAPRASIPMPVHSRASFWGATVIYLVVGIDQRSMAPWHENISAGDVARAVRTAVERAAAAGIGPRGGGGGGPELHCARASRERAGRPPARGLTRRLPLA